MLVCGNVSNCSTAFNLSGIKPTIKDVADLAECGIATVSRVLNNSGPASLDARERVLSAARQLGFQFNEVGRSLKSQRSSTVGVLVPTLSNPVFAEAVQGIQQAACQHGYDVILTSANYDRSTEEKALATLLAKQVDGIILTVSEPDNNNGLAMLDDNDIPHCLIFNQPSKLSCAAVGVDNAEAARQVGQKLFELGHIHAAFVAVRFSKSDRSSDRYKGFRQICAELGMAEPGLVEVDHAPGDLEIALISLFEKSPDTTALFASNDMLALCCIKALRSLGKKVPDDVSVVGFDGIAVAEMVHPKLATVATPCYDMGSKAAQLLIKALAEDANPPARVISLPFEFRSGESLGLAASKNADGRAVTRPSTLSTTPSATKHMK